MPFFRLAPVLLILIIASEARAADYFWNPATSSANWASTANWSAPTDGPNYTSMWSDGSVFNRNTAYFTGAGQSITVNSFIAISGIYFTADGISLVSGGGISDLRLEGTTVPISVSGSNTATISEDVNSIGAGGVLLKQGTGTLVLSGSNNITTVNISAGTLRLGSGAAIASISSSPSLIVDGTLDMGGFSANRGALSGSGLITSNTAAASTLTVGTGAAGNTTFGGIIQNGSGTLALAKAGTGRLTLSGNNTYTGGTTLNEGTLELNSPGAIGTTGLITFNGGTLRFTSNNTTDYSSRFSTAPGQQYRFDTNTTGIFVNLVSSLTSDGGSLNKLNAGTLTLSAANEFTGGVTITNGRLVLNNANALGSSGPITFAGGTMVFTSNNTVDYSTRFNALSGTNYSFDTNSQTVTLASDLSGTNIGMLKGGLGTLILSGTNSFNGASSLFNGTVRVNGSLGSSTVAINTGATLSGTGTVSGQVTVNTNGTVAPGNGIGTLNVGNTTFIGGGRFQLELSASTNTPVAGTDNDLLLGGPGSILDLSQLSSVNPFHIHVTAMGGGASGPVTYRIAEFDTITGASFGDVTNLFNVTGDIVSVPIVQTVDGPAIDYLSVRFTPVPEPSLVLPLAAVGLGALGLPRSFRIRNRKKYASVERESQYGAIVAGV